MPFVATMPNKAGLYRYKCLETDNKEEYAAIIHGNGVMYKELLVCEDGLGRTPLEHFHNNLCDVMWEFVA